MIEHRWCCLRQRLNLIVTILILVLLCSKAEECMSVVWITKKLKVTFSLCHPDEQWMQQYCNLNVIMAFNPLCGFRMPWVLHQMPGWDTIPISYCNHLAVRGGGPVLWLWTRGPIWHRHNPPELFWGCSESCGCTWCLHHVSWKRALLNWRIYHWPHDIPQQLKKYIMNFMTWLLTTLHQIN